MSKSFASKIKKNGSMFRGAPFWAWNAKLNPAELRRQIRIMKKMGLGGFFMHSRVGLNTAYLSEDWFKCISACIDEAKKQGMDAWLYDEDRWPSGAAGGYVTRDFPEFRNRSLVYNTPEELETDPPTTSDRILAWFAMRGRDKQSAKSYRRVSGPDVKLRSGEEMLCFAEREASTSPWFNEGTYLDTLNPQAVEKFIEITHEKYVEKCGEEFSKAVPGIFTDEPYFGSSLPWTGAFAEAFQKMHGYDVLEHLPEMFFRIGKEEFSKVRFDYRETATNLFINAFAKQIGKWCEKHGLDFTGHVLSEDTLQGQAAHVGDSLRFYEHMQAPGMDLLTEHWQIYRTAKQCTSMARQFGRRRRLSETNGCTGWDFSLEGHKALADWQIALGINLRCQHLAWYSMEAAAKRDYPASIFRQSPWHGIHSGIEDYFSRVCETLHCEDSSEIRDLLLLHPVESVWGILVERDESDIVRDYEAPFVNLGSKLLGANIDFDYGSEEVMSRHARVRGKNLAVAKASYKAVVLPQLLTIRSSTLELLAKFAAAGGQVFYVGAVPARVDGQRSVTARETYKNFTRTTMSKIADAVAPYTRRVSITENGAETEATLHLLSKSKDWLSVFVCNTSAEMPSMDSEMTFKFVRDRDIEYPNAELRVISRRCGDVFELIPSTGDIHRVDFTYSDGAYVIPCALGRLESRLFIITKNKLGRTRAPLKPRVKPVDIIELPSEGLGVSRSEPNVMVLDHPRYSINNSPLRKEKFILDVDAVLRKRLGASPRGGRMVQPWIAGEQKPKRELDVTLVYTFECLKLPEKVIELAIERPEFYEITFNGKKISNDAKGYWMDPVIKCVRLPRPRRGTNELILKCSYHQFLPGLETIYLLGEFGVKEELKMVDVPRKLDIGDWVEQGLENYSGNLKYSFNLGKRPETRKRINLRIPEWRGAALGVKVNGSEETLLLWPPYELDITDFLKDSRNRIDVTVYGHRRNTCGPFYIKGVKWPDWTGPFEMQRYEVRKRNLVPCGLLQPVQLAF